MTQEQKKHLMRRIAQVGAIVVECVRECGDQGAPGGYLYNALMTHGCTLEQFEAIMSALCRVGKLTKRGQCYYYVEQR